MSAALMPELALQSEIAKPTTKPTPRTVLPCAVKRDNSSRMISTAPPGTKPDDIELAADSGRIREQAIDGNKSRNGGKNCKQGIKGDTYCMAITRCSKIISYTLSRIALHPRLAVSDGVVANGPRLAASWDDGEV